MRFVFPILTLCKGGAQRMLAEITNGLSDRGHEVTIVMPRHGDVEYPVRSRLHRTDKTVLMESDFPYADFIISNFFTTVPIAQEASLAGKGRHVRLSLCYEPIFLSDQHITFPSYNVTKDIFVLSEYQKELIAINHGIQAKIIPVGVSDLFYNKNLRQSNAALTISAVLRRPEGGHSWQRNQDELVETLTNIKAGYPYVQVNCIVPANEYRLSAQLKKIMKLGLFNLQCPTTDEQLSDLYNRTDIFVSSSIHESALLPPLEAMKCGAAVAAYYAGGNKGYCRHEDTALTSFAYERNLYDHIARLILDKDLRERIAFAGHAESLKWTWDRSVNRFLEEIEHLS